MAPPSLHDFASWLKIVQAIDERIEIAIECYEREMSLNIYDIALAYNNLANLLNDGTVDYETQGIAIAYSLIYLPRKTCLLIALLSTIYSELQQCPRRVLDIGGGNGAAAMAADLTFDDSNIEIISIEPSQAMQDFVEYIPLDSKILWTPIAGNVDEFLDGAIYIPHEYCDLIIMSSCMQPDFLRQDGTWWASFGGRLLQAASKDALLISVEPYVKGDLTNRLDAGLQMAGWHRTADRTCRELPLVYRTKIALGRLDHVVVRRFPHLVACGAISPDGWRLLGRDFIRPPSDPHEAPASGPYPVWSWNNGPYYYERIMVYTRQS